MKTHLAQYRCGCKPARGWLTTTEEDSVTCGRCIREVKRRKTRKESEELHKFYCDKVYNEAIALINCKTM